MNDLIRPVADTYAFNARMVALGTSDLTPEDAVERGNGGRGSSIAYLVGHTASSRHGLLKMLGLSQENPFAELFGAGVECGDGNAYPPIAELAARWAALAGKLDAALADLSSERLLAAPAVSYPTPDQTVRGGLAFICWHECYHLGQIGMLRTGLGYPSLRARLAAAAG